MNNQIIPTILVKNKKELVKKLKKVERYVQRAQIDIIDGKFASNKTIGPQSFKELRTKVKTEMHLMVKDADSYVTDFIKIKPWMIIIHIESCRNKKHINALITQIQKAGIKAAIALKPETPAAKIKPFLKKIDQVLVMTVHPGFYGGKFLPKMLPKIRQIRKMSRKIDIEVDGGIRPGTAKLCKKSGANIFCSGSFIFKAKNIKTAIEELKKDIK
ncbi:MAG: ribulose-phosphate 3-epimerase [Candidatus Woesearchaeota archaeon]